MENKRFSTRAKVWPDTRAVIKYKDPMSENGSFSEVSGFIKDLGATGMFLITDEPVPIHTPVEIRIEFDPVKPENICMTAQGETVRRTGNGIGIRFTELDVSKLQQCILKRMAIGD